MNKAELALEIANKYQITKKSADEMGGMVFDTVTDVLARDEKLTLYGFGSLKPVTRQARMGHNPKTKAPVQIPQRKTVVLRLGLGLAARLNQTER